MKTSGSRKKSASITLARKIFREENNPPFKLRGAEITRIETFSDAVFAFSISLLVMALEVPKTFHELKQILQSFIPFAATVSLVFLFWYQQNRFFRHYGLNNITIIILNATLLLLVLFYVYPLKFLFSLLYTMFTHINLFEKATAQGETILTEEEFPQLVMIYSAGYAAIWAVIYFMYKKAWSLRKQLKLDFFEQEDTRKQLRGAFINIIIGIAALIFAFAQHPALGGICFFIIAPALALNSAYTKRRIKRTSITVQDTIK